MGIGSILNGADLGTIPSEQVVLASALLSAYVAYQTRKNSLETGRERERYLNFRLQDTSQFSDTWGIKVGNILVDEDSGRLYRLKKFVTGTISGTVTISVTYKTATIPGSFWEQEKVQDLIAGYDVEAEHLRTQEHLDPTPAVFRIESVKYEDVIGFFNYIIGFDQYMNRKRVSGE